MGGVHGVLMRFSWCLGCFDAFWVVLQVLQGVLHGDYYFEGWSSGFRSLTTSCDLLPVLAEVHGERDGDLNLFPKTQAFL